MAVTTTKTNKPINPRGNDQSPKGYNRAALYSGKALDFDGVNDVVNIGAEGGAYNDFTLVWNLKTAYASDFQSVFSAGNLQDFYLNSTGQFRIFIGTSYDTTSLPKINSGEWVNLVFTRSGSTGSFYYNGVLVETLTITTTTLNNTDVRIGTNQFGSYPFNGEMAGFKIFNTALTAAQVADLYNNPEKIVPTGVSNDALKLWLPMMEGAGTTAYDGSGNGNHGTISGATWTHGVGSPVSQTAVIDWNKQSYFAGNGGDDTYFTSSFADFNGQTAITMYAEFVWQGVTGNQNILDWGGNNGLRVRIEGTNDYFQVLQKGGSNILTSTTAATENAFARIAVRTDVNGLKLFLNGSEIASNSTALDSTASSTGFYIGRYESSTAEFFNGIIPEAKVWTSSLTDAQLESLTAGTTSPEDYTSGELAHWTGASEYQDQVGSYDLTAIGSPVRFIAPQGLTDGRDIFNALFENVRKQGTLNLDGNSWAEVHDNASLDMTDAITLEAWVYWDGVTTNSGILGRWFTGATSYMLYVSTGTQALFFINTSSTAATISGTGWKHIVGTYDSTIRRIYVDGQEIGSGDAYTSPIATNDKPIEVGRYAGDMSGAKSVKEQIAQPRIYNRALTAEEVERNYNAGKNIYK